MGVRKNTRQETLLAELRARPAVRLGELATLFGVSKETIRRDIAELSEQGLVARTYGGAYPAYLDREPDVEDRLRLNPRGRRRMAIVAAALVADARVLMIDPGSTMEHVAERLAATVPQGISNPALTVITNGFRCATALARNPAIRVIACPGTFDEGEVAAFGALAIEFIDRFKADVALIGAGGIDPMGVMDANSEAAAVKRAMIRQAGRTVLAIEGRKFNFAQFERVCGWGEIDDLVTDAALPEDLAAVLGPLGVAVHVAEEED